MDKLGYALLGVLVGVGVLAAIAIPNFVAMQYKSKRAEVPANIRGIKIAQLMYESNFDVYVKCVNYPTSPSHTLQKWIRSESGGFATLGWEPDGDVRGSYMVSTTTTNFTVTGLSDVDGDGTYATYVATKSINTNSPMTAMNIY